MLTALDEGNRKPPVGGSCPVEYQPVELSNRPDGGAAALRSHNISFTPAPYAHVLTAAEPNDVSVGDSRTLRLCTEGIAAPTPTACQEDASIQLACTVERAETT